MTDREFWMAIRRALFMILDAIELKYGLPRTQQMRETFKNYYPE